MENLFSDALFDYPGSHVKYVVVDSNLTVHGFPEEDANSALNLTKVDEEFNVQ
jgi:hypothetical protein